ncbi:MAG: hypothetical protein AAF242_00315 [Bacteroidota bacterium]
MMRLLCFVLLLLLPVIISAQKDSIQEPLARVAGIYGVAEAKKDIAKDQLGYYRLATPDPKRRLWHERLTIDYGVEIKAAACSLTEAMQCYNNAIALEMIKRFGSDAFEHLNQKVDTIFAKGMGERSGKVLKGEGHFRAYLYCNLDPLLFQQENPPKLFLTTTVQKTCQLTEPVVLRVFNVEGDSSIYTKPVVELIKKYPHFSPWSFNKKEQPSYWTIPVAFSTKQLTKYCQN